MPYLTLGTENVYAETWGSGEPLLLLHGGFCSLETMRELGGLLAERYEVHAPERAGHGRTADREGPYSYDRMTADTLAYLDAAGLDRAHVVGFSDGAIVALLLGRDHPDRVRSLVPISANISTDAFQPEDYPHETVPQRFHELLDEQYAELSPDGAEHGEVVLQKLIALWTAEPDIDPASLGSLTAPTLVLAGEHDAIREDHSGAIAAAVPGARLDVLPGTTHMLVAEEPAEVAARILAFLP